MTRTSGAGQHIVASGITPGEATPIRSPEEHEQSRLRAETAALEIEHRQFAEAQATARVGSFRVDVQARTSVWSEECYRILGMPSGEGGASVEAFFSRVHPDDVGSIQAALRVAADSRSRYVLDHRLLRPDGADTWVHGRCEYTYDDDGQPLTLVGTLQDINERKAAELALRHSEQLLRIASRIGRIGGWSIDLSTPSSTVSWSDEICAILGMPSGSRPSLEEAFDYYAPEYRDAIRASVEHCIATLTPFDIEVEVVGTGGERVWVRVAGEAEVDSAGNVSGLRGALQDISERMSAVRALSESDQRFRLAAQATSDVVWDWDADENKCWWSDGLQTKFGYSTSQPASPSFWEDNVHPEDRARVLTSIQAALSSGWTWLEEYRFRRADGSYALVSDRALVTCDDRGRARRMLGAMADITSQRILEARLDEAERLSTIAKLAVNMAHDFNNVLMGIQPFVEVIRRVTPGVPRAQDAVARIAKSVLRGKGITDEILQLTHRAEPIAKPNHIRDWLLDFVSQEDALEDAPLADVSPPDADNEGEGPDRRKSNPATRLPVHVLIVDDEPAVVDGIAMLLAAEGVVATSIFEGKQTIAAIERDTPGLVLLDIGLPDVSGVDVFRQIHRRWPKLRVILMSGHYNRSDLSEILEHPHVRFLQKPFDAIELLEAIAGG